MMKTKVVFLTVVSDDDDDDDNDDDDDGSEDSDDDEDSSAGPRSKKRKNDPFRDKEYSNISWTSISPEKGYSKDLIKKCLKFCETYSISLASIKFGVPESCIKNWKSGIQ